MGVLVQVAQLNESGFDALWEGWQVGSRPKGVSEFRTALKIEDKLCAVSEEKSQDGTPRVSCPKCKERFEQAHLDRFNYWRVPTMRKLNDNAEPIFLEDSEFAHLKAALQDIQPPQPRVRDYVAVWDMLDEAAKEKGSEVKLRGSMGPAKLELAK